MNTNQLPAGCTLSNDEHGLARIAIETELATGEVYLHGAHVTKYQPREMDEPVLFMSRLSRFEKDKPIRGGIPICFPWFGPKDGDPSAPAHGFARLMPWTLVGTNVEADGAIVLVLRLSSNEATRKLWPFDFEATCSVTVGKTLTTALTIKNTGTDASTYTEALHTYFTVGNVKEVSITGLAKTDYLDKTRNAVRMTQGDEPITFTEETDRPYLSTLLPVELHDPSLGREIRIEKTGSSSTVVWNPWSVKAKAMSDFGDDEWPRMVCIETANVAPDAIRLEPGESHTTTATVKTSKR